MDRDTAVTRVLQGLSFRRTGNDRVVEALKEAQRQREMGKTLPWFLLQEDQTFAGSANTSAIAFPSVANSPGWLRFHEEDGPKYYSGSPLAFVRKLEKASYDQLLEVWKDTTLTSPFAYAIRKTGIYVLPAPKTSYTIKASSYYQAQLLTTNVENAWLANAPDLLIADAGASMAAELLDKDALQKFLVKRQEAERALFGHITDREIQDEEIIMGGNN